MSWPPLLPLPLVRLFGLRRFSGAIPPLPLPLSHRLQQLWLPNSGVANDLPGSGLRVVVLLVGKKWRAVPSLAPLASTAHGNWLAAALDSGHDDELAQSAPGGNCNRPPASSLVGKIELGLWKGFHFRPPNNLLHLLVTIREQFYQSLDLGLKIGENWGLPTFQLSLPPSDSQRR